MSLIKTWWTQVYCLLLAFYSSSAQVFSHASQSRAYTTRQAPNFIEWYWRTPSRFVTLEVVWERAIYGDERILYNTFWTRFTTLRVLHPSLLGLENAELRIERKDPDKLGIEELKILLNGTIDHTAAGAIRCRVTTERGDNVTKVVYIGMHISCHKHLIARSIRFVCEPYGYGWLLARVRIFLHGEDSIGQNPVSIVSNGTGFRYVEYNRGCFLACYGGLGGPLITVVVSENCIVPDAIEILIDDRPDAPRPLRTRFVLQHLVPVDNTGQPIRLISGRGEILRVTNHDRDQTHF